MRVSLRSVKKMTWDDNLNASKRFKEYAAAHSYHVTRKVQEIGSRLGDRHHSFLKPLTDQTIGALVVELRAETPSLVSRPSRKRCNYAVMRLVAASLRFHHQKCLSSHFAGFLSGWLGAHMQPRC